MYNLFFCFLMFAYFYFSRTMQLKLKCTILKQQGLAERVKPPLSQSRPLSVYNLLQGCYNSRWRTAMIENSLIVLFICLDKMTQTDRGIESAKQCVLESKLDKSSSRCILHCSKYIVSASRQTLLYDTFSCFQNVFLFYSFSA